MCYLLCIIFLVAYYFLLNRNPKFWIRMLFRFECISSLTAVEKGGNRKVVEKGASVQKPYWMDWVHSMECVQWYISAEWGRSHSPLLLWYYLPSLYTVDFLYFLCFLIYFSILSLSIKKTPSPSFHWVTNQLNHPVFFYHFNQLSYPWERKSARLSSMEAMGPSLSVRCWFCSCCIRNFSLKFFELATGSGARDSPLPDFVKVVAKVEVCAPRNCVNHNIDNISLCWSWYI